MNDPLAPAFVFGAIPAEDVDETFQPWAEPGDPAPGPVSEPPPSQIRYGDTSPAANDVASAFEAADEPEIDRSVLFKRLSDPRLRRDLLSYVIVRKELAPYRADDVVQKTYLRALRAKTWPDEPDKMLAWMKSIADRSFIDDLRKGDRQAEVEEPCCSVPV